MSASKNTFTTSLQKFDSPLWGFHIIVPDDIAETFMAGGSKRIICTLFDEVEFPCALMSRGKVLESAQAGKFFININKKIRDKFRFRIGSEVQASIRSDNSKYGMPMPEEMAELLAQDPEGDEFFHALTPGKQRSLLFIAGKPKGAETRLKKSIVIIEHLKVNRGKVNFTQLNEDFKMANRR